MRRAVVFTRDEEEQCRAAGLARAQELARGLQSGRGLVGQRAQFGQGPAGHRTRGRLEVVQEQPCRAQRPARGREEGGYFGKPHGRSKRGDSARKNFLGMACVGGPPNNELFAFSGNKPWMVDFIFHVFSSLK